MEFVPLDFWNHVGSSARWKPGSACRQQMKFRRTQTPPPTVEAFVEGARHGRRPAILIPELGGRTSVFIRIGRQPSI